jgi:hypothetical protein
MRTILLMATVGAVASMAAAPVLAQAVEEHTTVVKKESGGTAPGAVGGAVAGALVAGPVGAVVGGVAGATVGHAVAPPTEVRTYVTTQNVAGVTYSKKVVVGTTMDGDVTWLEIPSYPKYRWAYLDGQRVVIDADTHKVVAIYE